MHHYHIILGLLWLLYCLIHSILARSYARITIMGFLHIRKDTYRLLYNIFALVSLAAILTYQFRITAIRLFSPGVVLKLLAILLLVSGLIIMLICIRKYFLQLSGLVREEQNKRVLETGGIHQYVRHPLYLGTFIFISGLFILFPFLTNLIAVVIIIAYTIIGILFEEKKLIAEFGEDYRRYQQKVPMLIPFLK